MLRALAVFIFLGAIAVSAQRVITVDESITRNADKNLFLAIGASALLPGMGELYLDEPTHVRPFVWADAALWITTFTSYFIGEKFVTSAMGQASRYAGAHPPRDIDFLNTMGKYRSRGGIAGQNSSPDMNEDYNQAMIREGRAVDAEYPNTERYSWDWGSSDNPQTTKNMNRYNDILRNYRISRIIFQISVGALIVNRVISILDVMQIHRSTSSKEFTNIQVAPQFFPDGSGATLFVGF